MLPESMIHNDEAMDSEWATSKNKNKQKSLVEEKTQEISNHSNYLERNQLKKLEEDIGCALSINTQFYLVSAALTKKSKVRTSTLFKAVLAAGTPSFPSPIREQFYSRIYEEKSQFVNQHLHKIKQAIKTANFDRGRENDSFIFSMGVIKALKLAAKLCNSLDHRDSKKLSPSHLLAGLLMREKGSLSEFLSDTGLSKKWLVEQFLSVLNEFSYSRSEMARWHEFFEPVTGLPFPREASGRKSSFNRNSAPDSITPDTHRYASAITETFRNAGGGDFALGIFGPWGRGKTTLVDSIEERLSENPEASPSHTCVRFNAWKYPERPEVWLHLYEEVKKVAVGGSSWRSAHLGIQTKILVDRGWPLVIPSILLLFASIPKWAIGQWLISGAAILSVLFVLNYIQAFSRCLVPVVKGYLRLPDHSKNLGFQSTVGTELATLLQIWTRKRGGFQTSKIFGLYFVALVLLIFSLAVSWWRLSDMLPPFCSIVFWGGILMVGCFGIAASRPVSGPDKVLLVVDDLDRCDPRQMLAVIEAVRVFLDDGKISEMLQVAMLADKDILSAEIERKYSRYLVARKSGMDDDEFARFKKQLVEEELEKLFVLQFSLPPLSDSEMSAVAESIFGSQNTSGKSLREAKEREEDPARSDTEEELKTGDIIKAVGAEKFSTKNREEPLPKIHDFERLADEVTDDERRALWSLVISESRENGRSITPRRMRSIYLRYLFGRSLMLELYGDSAPLIELRQGLSSKENLEDQDPRVSRVLELIG